MSGQNLTLFLLVYLFSIPDVNIALQVWCAVLFPCRYELLFLCAKIENRRNHIREVGHAKVSHDMWKY